MKDKLLICNHREFLTHYLIKKFPRARKEDIEDAVQNAIIKAVRFSDKWQGNCSLKTWVSVIASNMYTDIFRKTYVKNEYVLNSSEESYIFENISENDFSQTFCESDYRHKLVNALMAGFEDNVHIQAFKLNVLDGIDYKEISMMQNVPLGTIKSRVFRGKKLLRDKYQEICNQEACLRV